VLSNIEFIFSRAIISIQEIFLIKIGIITLQHLIFRSFASGISFDMRREILAVL
jgi:hypothetical protein